MSESDLMAALLGSEGGTLRWPNDTLRGHRNYSDTDAPTV